MKDEIGRLAMRVEGNWWVAYHADLESMDNAIELARISMALIEENEAARQGFIYLMQKCVAKKIAAIADKELPESAALESIE